MFKAAIKRRIANHLLSVERRNAKRRKAERKRQKTNAPHVVEYFHEAGDPYSHLMVQLLPEFARRYNVELIIHIVPPPEDWAAPERGKMEAYSRKDAALLAGKTGLEYSDPGEQPPSDSLLKANIALAASIEEGTFLQRAPEIGQNLWMGGELEGAEVSSPSIEKALAAGAERRKALGHYLGGTLYYAGEWYWGSDRLHFLETRLQDLGAKVADAPGNALIYSPPEILTSNVQRGKNKRQELHWYFSFRSPYSAIVRDRVKALADHYDADLKLRFVLPMVMRGMKVPSVKRFYIASDVVREAERMNIPFGDVCDPLGEPVERGYAILQKAIELGKGYEFTHSFLRGVWAEGINAGSDSGLGRITERAGLSWVEMRPLIGQDLWRDEEKANQAEMLELGIWGVPSFRVGEVTAWGQDRLWIIEDALAGEPSKD